MLVFHIIYDLSEWNVLLKKNNKKKSQKERNKSFITLIIKSYLPKLKPTVDNFSDNIQDMYCTAFLSILLQLLLKSFCQTEYWTGFHVIKKSLRKE